MGWYQRVLARTGRAPAVWMLIGFLVTFAATRAITHRIRARRRYSGAKLARARSGASGAPTSCAVTACATCPEEGPIPLTATMPNERRRRPLPVLRDLFTGLAW